MTRNLALNGRDGFAGRKFVGQLLSESWQAKVGHLAWPTDRVASADMRVPDDLFSIDELNEFEPHCVFFEEGALAAGNQELKIPADWLTGYVRAGGVLIVEGLDRGYFQSLQPTEASNTQKQLLQLVLADAPDSDPMAPPYIRDDVSNDGHPANIICHPPAMIMADWLRPVYEGIDQVVVGSPVPLVFRAEILGTTEPSATVLKMDMYQNWPGPFLWAKVLTEGLGYIAVIAGSVVHDHWVDENPDNARWLQNLIVHLVDAAQREVLLRGGAFQPATQFTATAMPEETRRAGGDSALTPISHLLDREEAVDLEFKETARFDIALNKTEDHITHSALKTIAAFINTEGGTLLIGVRDHDKHPVGVERDIATLNTSPTLDGFHLWLNNQIKQAMGDVAASLARIGFEKVNDADICRVDVTRGKRLIPMSAKKGKDKNGNVLKDDRVLYVRLGAESDALAAADVPAWIEQHRGR